MPTTIHDDDAADLALIQSRVVAVIGGDREPGEDGSSAGLTDGLAHALSLRDSGVEVLVGQPAGSPAAVAAADEGLTVLPQGKAVAAAELTMLVADPPTPAARRRLFDTAIAPNLREGAALLAGRAFPVRFGLVRPPGGVDVAMVSPMAEADQVRAQFAAGRGVPCLVAVHADVSGSAWPLALSYARAIGCTRAGALSTTFAEAADTELFGEQAIRGGLVALVRAGFEALVDAGYSPEVAYLGCTYELERVARELVSTGDAPSVPPEAGTDGGRGAGSRVVSAGVATRLREILDEIADGSVAHRQDTGRGRAGAATTRRGRHARATDEPEPHLIAQAAHAVRALMPWHGA